MVGKRQELYGIQYLRAVAAIMVVIYHLSWQATGKNAGVPLITLKSGVDIFFVISGFVMMYSTDGGSSITPAMFFRKRLARIAPLYLAATLFTILILLLAPSLVQSAKLIPEHAIKSLLFLPHPNPAMPSEYRPLVVPGWTLNLEMMFYLVFAIGIAVSKGRERTLLLIVGASLALLTLYGVVADPVGMLDFYSEPVILEFLFGMVLGYSFRAGWFARIPAWPMALAGAAAFAIMIALPAGTEDMRPLRYGLPAIVIVMAALIIPFPHWGFPHLLGASSYSLYLSHFFAVSFVAQVWSKLNLWQLPASGALFCAFGTIVALLAAVVCWRLIEKPLTRAAEAVLVNHRDGRTGRRGRVA